MGIYDDLLPEKQPGKKLEKLQRVEPGTIEKLKIAYPKLPADYLSFLDEVGAGEMGSSAYMLYNGILEPDDIYDAETAEGLGGLLIFGDDMQGYCFGFDTGNDWAIIEIDPTDMSYRKTFNHFSEFIRDRLSQI